MPRRKSQSLSSHSRSIDLHGMTTDEAKRTLLAALDKCLLDDIDELRVIHGFGTGKVKDAVHKLLSSMKQVKEFRIQLGNAGVTIVFL